MSLPGDGVAGAQNAKEIYRCCCTLPQVLTSAQSRLTSLIYSNLSGDFYSAMSWGSITAKSLRWAVCNEGITEFYLPPT